MFDPFLGVPWYEDLWRGWLDMFHDGAIGITFGTIIGLIVTGIALLILYGIFRAADQWFTPKQEGAGRIATRKIIPGYWQATTKQEWTYSWSEGKYVWVTVAGPPEWVPERYLVEVILTDGNVSKELEVDASTFNGARAQLPVRITFQRGRLSNTVYINTYANA
jgi:hypothetical protein